MSCAARVAGAAAQVVDGRLVVAKGFTAPVGYEKG